MPLARFNRSKSGRELGRLSLSDVHDFFLLSCRSGGALLHPPGERGGFPVSPEGDTGKPFRTFPFY